MARTKKAPRPQRKLAPFEGKDVLNVAVSIRNTGDGLSEALGVDRVELHHGQTVYVVLECEVEKVRFDPIKDTEGLTRTHMLKAGGATLVDEDLVREHLDAQAERVDAAAGVHKLPGMGSGTVDPDEGADESEG